MLIEAKQKNYSYKKVIHQTTHLQALTPDQLTPHVFTQVQARAELSPHEDTIRREHSQMLSEHADSSPRRLSGYPYSVHPEQVALTVINLLDLTNKPLTVDTFIASLHHDVVEDRKTPKGRRLMHPSEKPIIELVEAVTRHPNPKDTKNEKKGRPIGPREAAKKVRRFYDDGVTDAIVLKVADRLVNILDQPGVSKPPLRERLLYSFTKEYRKSDYGKWKRLKRRTKGSFSKILLYDQPDLKGVLYEGMRTTQKEINNRPRKSYRKE